MHTTQAIKYAAAVGYDHAGYDLHQSMLRYWNEQKLSVLDVGTHSCESTDYPIYAQYVCDAIIQGSCDKGLLICGSGIGMAMAANRFSGIRAVWADRVEIVLQARQHNNANVLCVGALYTNQNQLIELWQTLIQTPFDDAERHVRRVQQLDVMSSKMF